MARAQRIELRLPDDKGWADIRKGLKLNKAAMAALQGTLEEATAACLELAARPMNAALKAGIAKADRALEKLEKALASKDVIAALRGMESYGAMGLLISASAVPLLDDGIENDIAVGDLERFLARKKSRNEAVKPAELDSLSLANRQRSLQTMTPEAMQFAVRSMRQPISAWLHQARQDKGGIRPNTDRELLIFVLARDAPKIIGQSATSTANGKFMELCTWVFGACGGLETTGIEDAVKRCLKKHKKWLKWYRLPAYTSPIGVLTEEQLRAIPDGPEADLK